IKIFNTSATAKHENLFVGGVGNDTLTGAQGADTYLFNRGDGQDVISDVGGTDKIVFGEGITAENLDIWVQPGTKNLLIDIQDPENQSATDRITINSGYQSNQGRWIERLEFSDGTYLTAENVLKLAEVRGTANADTISASAMDDLVKAGDGNDKITGYIEANNRMYGEAGDDTISIAANTYSAKYENLFVGGTGNDTLTGAYSADTYLFNRGDGSDLVYNAYNRDDNTDSLLFSSGVSADQLWFSRLGNDLIVSVIGTQDKVTIKSWYSGANNQLDEIRTPSEVLYANQVDQLVSAMSEFAAPAIGETVLSDDMDTALQPALAAAWQTA
ncbi:MAG: calcium-binding protein, partial [Chromatiales bacterium]